MAEVVLAAFADHAAAAEPVATAAHFEIVASAVSVETVEPAAFAAFEAPG